jgi:hypothetical protein
MTGGIAAAVGCAILGPRLGRFRSDGTVRARFYPIDKRQYSAWCPIAWKALPNGTHPEGTSVCSLLTLCD